MPNIVSNPLFQVMVLFVGASGSWYLVTDETSAVRNKVLTFVTDGLYYFILGTFGLNLLVNFREILKEPYRVLLFSSEISWISLMVTLLYLGYRKNKKQPYLTEHQNKLINQAINYFLLLGLFNHLFYYYKYRSINSIIFILVYFLFYLFKDRIHLSRINEITLLTLALIHGLVMYSFSKIIIYYQIVFYPYQITSLLVLASLLIYYFRRDFLSKQK